MSQFLGAHHNRLDSKGRVSVPAQFRTTLRQGAEPAPIALVLRRSHQNPCVECYPPAFFESLGRPLEQFDMFSEEIDDMTTVLYADAWPVEADKEGRILLPDSLVRHASLTDAVTFMGRGRHFQIWEPQAADRYMTEARERARSRRLTLPGLPSGAAPPMTPAPMNPAPTITSP